MVCSGWGIWCAVARDLWYTVARDLWNTVARDLRYEVARGLWYWWQGIYGTLWFMNNNKVNKLGAAYWRKQKFGGLTLCIIFTGNFLAQIGA